MKFNDNVVKAAKDHAIRKFPHESCGIVSNGKYIECENVSKDSEGISNTLNHFEIDQFITRKHYMNRSLEGIIHSHCDHPHLSEDDIEGQNISGVPWGVSNVKNGVVTLFHEWGGEHHEPLVGREFIGGAQDCYGLVRDYFKERGVELENYERSHEWWKKENQEPLIEKLFKKEFYWIDAKELEEGDVVIFEIRSKNGPNHTAVYIGNDQILHHLQNQLSKKDLLYTWRKHIVGYGRYRG